MTDYLNKVVELQADVQTIWKLQCQNLYNSKNLGALAVRECLQNSIDAVRKAIKDRILNKDDGLITIDFDESSTVTIEDNGVGMDMKTIHDKFLKLGGTTKGDEDSVGGFGLAKAVILGCGDWFSIETQDNYMCSDDLGKRPIIKTQYRQGTKIILKNVQVDKNTLVGDCYRLFENSIREYILSSDIPYKVVINGKSYNQWFEKSRKTYRSPLTFNISSSMIPDITKLSINVFKENNSNAKYLFVRLHGLTQFKQYLGWNANCHIVIDFNSKLDPRSVDYPFSTNREGLKAQYQGILEAIRDKVTQSPLSISSNDDFKETLFDNLDSSINAERKINACLTNSATLELVEEVDKIVSGIQPQGGYTQPSVADRAKQYQDQIKHLATQYGKTPEEFVKTMSHETSQSLDNPLEYSWIIWEDKDWSGRKLNKSKAVDIIILWDSILRTLASCYSGLNGKVFYPGIIVEQDTMGVCVEKTTSVGEQRCYIMINPFTVPVEDDTQTAIYLMGLASHELSHFACGCYEAHGETFSYTREAIMNNSLPHMHTVVQLVKKGRMRKKVSNLTRSRQISQKTDSAYDFKGMSIDNIIRMAEDFKIDVCEFQHKYTSEPILRMRLIMEIKNYQ